MSGLREKKKKKTEAKILNTTKQLFEKNGYTSTTIEEIAEKSEVGVGTIYNYFKSKADILVSILINNIGSELNKGIEYINNYKDEDIIDSLSTLMIIHTKALLTFNRKLWKELYSIADLIQQQQWQEGFGKINNTITQQITLLVEKFKEKNLIIKEVNNEDIMYIFANMFTMKFQMFLFINDNMTIEELEKEFKRYIKIIYNGLKPKQDKNI